MKKFKIIILTLTIFFSLSLISSGEEQKKIYTLEDSIKIALQNSLDLMSSDKDVLRSQTKISQARTGRYPNFYGNVTYTRTDPVQSLEVNGKQMELGKNDQGQGKLSFAYTLYDGGLVTNQIDQATLASESVKYDRETSKQNVIYKAMEGYYNVLRTKNLMMVSQDSINTAQEQYKRAQAFYEEGLVPRADVTSAQAQLSNAELGFIKAQTNVENAKAFLKDIMNISLEESMDVSGELKIEPANIDLNILTKIALANRPEIKKLQYLTQAAEKAINIAKSGFLPNVYFNFDYTLFSSSTFTASNSIAATVGLNVPIFDRGVTKYKVEEAEINLEQSKIAIDNMKKSVSLQVKQAYLNFLEASESVEKVKVSLLAAQENYDISNLRYQEGIAPFIEVSQSRYLLTQAQTDNVQAFYGYFIARVTLIRVAGLLPEDGNLDNINISDNNAGEEESGSLPGLENK